MASSGCFLTDSIRTVSDMYRASDANAERVVDDLSVRARAVAQQTLRAAITNSAETVRTE